MLDPKRERIVGGYKGHLGGNNLTNPDGRVFPFGVPGLHTWSSEGAVVLVIRLQEIR